MAFGLETVSDELQTGKTMTLLSSNRKSDYWSRMVKKINKVFVIFYFMAIAAFLAKMTSMWKSTKN